MFAIPQRNDPSIARYTRALDRIFQTHNKHEAHRHSSSVLQDLAADKAALTAILKRFVSSEKHLNTLNFPALGIDVALTPYYGLVVNCFFPHPDGRTDLTANSVHHHGELLLTTVNGFGPGYEHWLFRKPQPIDPDRDLFRIEFDHRERHERGNLAFVDAYIPHAVMYPPGLSITFALWSSRQPVSWRDHVKRLSLFKGNEKRLRALARRLGLSKTLALKVASYYDYYPCEGGFRGMRERVQLERGPNEHFLYGLFHVLQQTHNEGLARDMGRVLQHGAVDSPSLIRQLLAKLRHGEAIPYRYTDNLHLGVSHMQFPARAIEEAVAR
jgi:hypothetical protein